MAKINKKSDKNLVIYQTKAGALELREDLKKETIWATQAQIAQVFGVNPQAIIKHIANIYKDGELMRRATCSKMEQVRFEGERRVVRNLEIFNLDMIISVGYRVNSKNATNFRIWATETLRKHIIESIARHPQAFDEITFALTAEWNFNLYQELLKSV